MNANEENFDLLQGFYKNKIVIAGPCSAESETQLQAAAEMMVAHGIRILRCGIWKPRTRAGGFEGMGEAGLQILRRVCDRYNLLPAIEVATLEHVRAAKFYNIPIVWLGARTVTNPFSVQELASSLVENDCTVLVKNPVITDIELWVGAIERLQKAGVVKLGIIHRGFSIYGKSVFRNSPCWNIPLEMRLRFPKLPILCDPSHISGKSALVPMVAKTALDMGFSGVFVEAHPSPAEALTDAEQQLSPDDFAKFIKYLFAEKSNLVKNSQAEATLKILRKHIHEIDAQIVEALAARINTVREIASQKQLLGLEIYQPHRWNEVLDFTKKYSGKYQISEKFVEAIFHFIHEESVNEQIKFYSKHGS